MTGAVSVMKALVDKLLAAIISVCVIALTVVVIWQVFSRYALHAPSTYTDELARYLMIYMTFLGAAYTAGRRQHLAIDLLTGWLQRVLSPFAVALIYHGAVLIFAIAVLIAGGTGLIVLTAKAHNITPVMGLAVSRVYLILPVTGVIMVFYSITSLILEYGATRASPSPQPES